MKKAFPVILLAAFMFAGCTNPDAPKPVDPGTKGPAMKPTDNSAGKPESSAVPPAGLNPGAGGVKDPVGSKAGGN
jgi:hypothetical protein